MNVLLHPIALAIIAVFSTARMARLITFDEFPPVAWLRQKGHDTLPGSWKKLVLCPFCLTPYLMAVQIAWFLALYHHHDAFLIWWLLPNLWWAGSYVASIICAYDQPEE